MPLVIPVAHDFICPWCWIALFQAKRLAAEFDVVFDWLGYELFPEELAWPEPGPAAPEAPANRPKTPSRLELAYAAEGMAPPTAVRPKRMRSFHAHEALEYAKVVGRQDAMLEALYRALWERGEEINDPVVLRRLAVGIVDDLEDFESSVRERRFRANLVPFDDGAYAMGVYNVPTYWIGGERYAEQPTTVLRQALWAHAGSRQIGDLYADLSLGTPLDGRPYVAINMAATIDGKIVTGERDEAVMDLGSKVDHEAMRRIEAAADAVMIGAGTLRATKGLWYPTRLRRYVVTASGDLPRDGRFFSDAPDRAHVLASGGNDLDWPAVLASMRKDHGVERLLVEGGSEVNASLLAADLVDELFLTIAPKVKLGRGVPTYAGGDPLPRESLLRFALVSERRIGDEVFLRYRRVRS